MQRRNFMKKILCFILVALLCVGCGNNNANKPNMDNQDFGKVENNENEDTLDYVRAYIDKINEYEAAHSNYECKYGLIYVDNDEWYTTQEKTLQEPSTGFRQAVAKVTYRNDKEISKEVVKEVVLMEAVPKIVERGTKIPPTFIKPISGGRLTSRFGRRTSPTRGASSNHKGVDWGIPRGSSVVASSGGTVTKAGWGGGYGYVVYIKHPGGAETRYAHLNNISAWATIRAFASMHLAVLRESFRQDIRVSTETTRQTTLFCLKILRTRTQERQSSFVPLRVYFRAVSTRTFAL